MFTPYSRSSFFIFLLAFVLFPIGRGRSQVLYPLRRAHSPELIFPTSGFHGESRLPVYLAFASESPSITGPFSKLGHYTYLFHTSYKFFHNRFLVSGSYMREEFGLYSQHGSEAHIGYSARLAPRIALNSSIGYRYRSGSFVPYSSGRVVESAGLVSPVANHYVVLGLDFRTPIVSFAFAERLPLNAAALDRHVASARLYYEKDVAPYFSYSLYTGYQSTPLSYSENRGAFSAGVGFELLGAMELGLHYQQDAYPLGISITLRVSHWHHLRVYYFTPLLYSSPADKAGRLPLTSHYISLSYDILRKKKGKLLIGK